MGSYNKGEPNFWEKLLGKKSNSFLDTAYNRNSEKRTYVETKVYNQKNIKPKQIKELSSIIVEDRIDAIPDVDDISFDNVDDISVENVDDIKVGTIEEIEKASTRSTYSNFEKSYDKSGNKGYDKNDKAKPNVTTDKSDTIADLMSNLEQKRADAKDVKNASKGYGGSTYTEVKKETIVQTPITPKDEGKSTISKEKSYSKINTEKKEEPNFFDWETTGKKINVNSNKANTDTKLNSGKPESKPMEGGNSWNKTEDDLTKKLDSLLNKYNANPQSNSNNTNKKSDSTDFNLAIIIVAAVLSFSGMVGVAMAGILGVFRFLTGKQVEGIIIIIITVIIAFVRNT